MKTQSFWRIAEPFIWNFIDINDTEGKDSIGVLETDTEEKDLIDIVEHDTEGKDSIGVLVPPLPPPGATFISPMLVSKSSNKKQKLMEVTMNGSVSLNDNDYDPRLSCALGQEDVFNPLGPTIQQIMQVFWQK